MSEIIPDIFLRGIKDPSYAKLNRMKEAFVPSRIQRPDGDYDVSTNHEDKAGKSIRILSALSVSSAGILRGNAVELLSSLKNLTPRNMGDKPHLPEIADSFLVDLIHFEDPEKDEILKVPGNPYHWSLVFSAKLCAKPDNSGEHNQSLLRAIALHMVQNTNIQFIPRFELDQLPALISDDSFF